MLFYLNSGERYYGKKPISHGPRPGYEFQCIAEGGCYPTGLSASSAIRSMKQGRCLWVSNRGSEHGWGDAPEGRSFIYVFHFSSVPVALRTVLQKEQNIQIAIDPIELETVKRAHEELDALFPANSVYMDLLTERVKYELTLIALKKQGMYETHVGGRNHERVVKQALAYYQDNLYDLPTVETVAKQVGVSSSHLRRLFYDFAKHSPQKAFLTVKMNEALLLLRQGRSQKEVATLLGFSEVSSFNRAFRQFHGRSPGKVVIGLNDSAR